MNKTTHTTLILLTVLAFAVILLPGLTSEGMFLDGITHAAIARNMAEGKGGFWSPFYTRTLYSVYYEHPPLGFWLESLLFRILPDTFYVEKIFSLLTALATGILIAVIWNRIAPGKERKEYMLLPVLLWLVLPSTGWAYSNNMLENILGVFTCLAVLLMLKGLYATSAIKQASYLSLSGLSTAAAVLIKGPVALFPLAFILLFFFTDKKNNLTHSLRLSMIPAASLLLVILLLSYYRPASDFFCMYLDRQVFQSLEGKRELSSRFTILLSLSGTLLVPAALSVAATLLSRKWNIHADPALKKSATLMLLTGLSASLPLLISPKQKGFYIIPSIPWFALAASLWILPPVQYLFAKLSGRNAATGAIKTGIFIAATVAATLVMLNAGKTGRDKDLIGNVKQIGALVPRNEIIRISPSISEQWALHAYLARYFMISLHDKASSPFFLSPASETIPPGNCEKNIMQTPMFNLYECKK